MTLAGSLGPTCPYCAGLSELVVGDVIYPHRPDLAAKKVWRCPPCNAYVGCHPGTTKPLGRLANAALREAKIQAHAAFDPLWRTGWMGRHQAYGWLAMQLGLARDDCHIGLFDLDGCQRVVTASRAYIAEKYQGEACVYVDDFDPATLEPLGRRCGRVAKDVIFWTDGRFSAACGEHGFTILTPETRLLVFSVQTLVAA